MTLAMRLSGLSRQPAALGLASALSLLCQPALAGWTIIQAGTVISQPGKPPLTNASIVIHDGKISAIRSGFATAADVPEAAGTAMTIVDLKKAFVLPGLIDAHVHITSELGPNALLESVTKNPEDLALDGAVYAERTLQAGFTTVRDLGAAGHSSLSLRDAIEAGHVAGPTIVAAGNGVAITAGHGDVNGFNEKVLEALHPLVNCDGPETCRRAVREQIKRGADVIKIATTGGVLSQIAAGTGQQMMPDEITAVVEVSHMMGKKVAAHAHAAAGIKAALIGGVDSIEHGSYLDDESVGLLKKSGAYLVPTLLAGATVGEMADRPGAMSPVIAEKARAVGTVMQANFRKAVAAGVKIAFGTDTGVSAHGQNAREFALMVKAGMTPADTIKSATISGADLLSRSSRIGSLEPGKDADIIAVEANPLDNVTALETVSFVMRLGVVHKLDGKRQAFDNHLAH